MNETAGVAAGHPRVRSVPVRLGVLGGMGPAATADFFAKLTILTPAVCDQEHIPTIVCSFPEIPDRTEAILEGGPSPVPGMLRALEMLERCGATYIAIPCNTAHHWFDTLQRKISVPILHVVDAVRDCLGDRGFAAMSIGLLATTATLRTGIYQSRLAAYGYECLSPNDRDQAEIMNVIRATKAGRTGDPTNSAAIDHIVRGLMERGARAIVIACSELPLVIRQKSPLYVDATEALAMACVRRSRIG
jgi:aspartate racemase